MMGARIFFDRAYTTHMSIPRNVSGISSFHAEVCQREDQRAEQHGDVHPNIA